MSSFMTALNKSLDDTLELGKKIGYIQAVEEIISMAESEDHFMGVNDFAAILKEHLEERKDAIENN